MREHLVPGQVFVEIFMHIPNLLLSRTGASMLRLSSGFHNLVQRMPFLFESLPLGEQTDLSLVRAEREQNCLVLGACASGGELVLRSVHSNLISVRHMALVTQTSSHPPCTPARLW